MLFSPLPGSYDKRRGAKSGHEPLFLMTAESAGNFSCAATRNDCNVNADAGMSCYSPISSWWQEGETHSSSLCISGSGFYFGLCHSQSDGCCDDWEYFKTSLKILMQGSQCKWMVIKTALMENTRTWCAVLGVWLRVSGGANGKASSPSACVPVDVFSGMAVDKQQRNMVLILLLAPLQPVILWFENTRDLGWSHAHEDRIIP